MTTKLIAPMLSATVEDVATLPYPLLASPKLDGYRATVQEGELLSRNQKLIPNAFTQKLYGCSKYEGLDGELIVGLPTAQDVFSATSSGVRRADGNPNVKFYVFDGLARGVTPFNVRLDYLRSRYAEDPNIVIVEQVWVNTAKELLAYESRALATGYEGVMLRKADGLYKQGRSTAREAYLMKLKVFEYDNARVLQVIEGQHNTNEDVKDAFGHAKRSTKQAGMVPAGTAGGFRVLGLTGPFKGTEFHVGAGKLNAADRKAALQHASRWVGTDLCYKHFARGSKDAPRFPLYYGNPVDKE